MRKTIFLDVIDGRQSSLSNKAKIEKYIIKAVALCGQTIAPETLQSYAVKGQKDKDGISQWIAGGSVLLLESHFYVHTWTKERYAHIEMASCNAPGIIGMNALASLTAATFGGTVLIDQMEWKTKL